MMNAVENILRIVTTERDKMLEIVGDIGAGTALQEIVAIAQSSEFGKAYDLLHTRARNDLPLIDCLKHLSATRAKLISATRACVVPVNSVLFPEAHEGIALQQQFKPFTTMITTINPRPSDDALTSFDHELIQLGDAMKAFRKLGPAATNWPTITATASMLGMNKGNVSRLLDDGVLLDNGQ